MSNFYILVLIKRQNAALSFATQNAMSRELDDDGKTECINITISRIHCEAKKNIFILKKVNSLYLLILLSFDCTSTSLHSDYYGT